MNGATSGKMVEEEQVLCEAGHSSCSLDSKAFWDAWKDTVEERSQLKTRLKILLDPAKEKHPYTYLNGNITSICPGKSVGSTQIIMLYLTAAVLDPDRMRAFDIMGCLYGIAGDNRALLKRLDVVFEAACAPRKKPRIISSSDIPPLRPLYTHTHSVDWGIVPPSPLDKECGEEAPLSPSTPCNTSLPSALDIKDQELEICQNYIQRLEDLNAKMEGRIRTLEESIEAMVGHVYGNSV